jgi:hypothetical protein
MSENTRKRDRRLVPLSAEVVQYLRDVVERRGLVGAARILRIPADTIARCIVREACMPGTAALIRESIRGRDRAA